MGSVTELRLGDQTLIVLTSSHTVTPHTDTPHTSTPHRQHCHTSHRHTTHQHTSQTTLSHLTQTHHTPAHLTDNTGAHLQQTRVGAHLQQTRVGAHLQQTRVGAHLQQTRVFEISHSPLVNELMAPACDPAHIAQSQWKLHYGTTKIALGRHNDTLSLTSERGSLLPTSYRRHARLRIAVGQLHH